MAAGGRLSRTGAALLLMGFLAACAANGPQRSGRQGSADRADPTVPRSQRGNPPFYEVFGKRYHVLESSTGYADRGIASWYGRDFHGLATSSGETYNMHAMTAAHTTLPIPTWVEVTNLTNGRRVVVRVNDRGPFVDNRLIDLSFAAATELDMVRAGTTRVEVRAIGAPLEEARPGTTATATPVPVPPSAAPVVVERMFVQVGAFSRHDNAARLIERLRASGFVNPSLVSEPNERRLLHRVRLGPIRDATEFDALNARLRAMGVAGSRLVVDRLP